MKNKDVIRLMKNKAEKCGYLDNEDVVRIMDCLLASDDGYIADYCTVDQGNAIMMLEFLEKVKKHPLIWKWLFMIA